MATEPQDSDSDTDRILKVEGIYPDAVETFSDQIPEVQEGDYIIGGRFREDFKPFVYSGLLSEFPVNGESVFIVTERGEEVATGYETQRDFIGADPEVSRDEAYQVFNAESDGVAQALLTEELLSQYRREQEHERKESPQEAWKIYLDLGNEMLNNWEETYHRAERSNSEEVQEYAEILGEQIDKLTGDLIKLADTHQGRHIEPVRNAMYEMENLTESLKETY